MDMITDNDKHYKRKIIVKKVKERTFLHTKHPFKIKHKSG